jgi:hypothetical protein
MPRGRPLKTDIRERIGLILSQVNFAYGYELFKIYKNVFGEIGLRNLYYNLKKGLQTGEFIIAHIEREPGSFTWGAEAQHIYYGAGPYMMLHKPSEKILLKLKQSNPKDKKIDWENEIKQLIAKLRNETETFKAIENRLRYEDKRKFNSNLKLKGLKLKEWGKLKLGKEKLSGIYSEIDGILKILE